MERTKKKKADVKEITSRVEKHMEDSIDAYVVATGVFLEQVGVTPRSVRSTLEGFLCALLATGKIILREELKDE